MAVHEAFENRKKTLMRTPEEALRLLRKHAALPPGTGEEWMKEIIQEREMES